jgi:hypothetical protein
MGDLTLVYVRFHGYIEEAPNTTDEWLGAWITFIKLPHRSTHRPWPFEPVKSWPAEGCPFGLVTR